LLLSKHDHEKIDPETKEMIMSVAGTAYVGEEQDPYNLSTTTAYQISAGGMSGM
jgi:hypothetical protein